MQEASVQAAEVRAASAKLAASGIRAATLCAALTTVLALVEQIRHETPTWRVWKSAPVAIAISVLRGVQAVLCPANTPTS